jgi:hypothetical protein
VTSSDVLRQLEWNGHHVALVENSDSIQESPYYP